MIYNNYCIVSDMNIIRFCIWLILCLTWKSTKLKSTINTSQRLNPPTLTWCQVPTIHSSSQLSVQRLP